MKMNWIDPEALSAATHMFDRPMTMEEALTLDGEKLRQLTGEDHGPWTAQDDDRDYALATVRQALNDDSVAATMVAATINTRQAAGESGPAFVKRIVRSWLEEMGQ